MTFKIHFVFSYLLLYNNPKSYRIKTINILFHHYVTNGLGSAKQFLYWSCWRPLVWMYSAASVTGDHCASCVYLWSQASLSLCVLCAVYICLSAGWMAFFTEHLRALKSPKTY